MHHYGAKSCLDKLGSKYPNAKSDRLLVLGIVTKINRKSVIVLDEDGTKQYKISPGPLRPLRDVK